MDGKGSGTIFSTKLAGESKDHTDRSPRSFGPHILKAKRMATRLDQLLKCRWSMGSGEYLETGEHLHLKQTSERTSMLIPASIFQSASNDSIGDFPAGCGDYPASSLLPGPNSYFDRGKYLDFSALSLIKANLCMDIGTCDFLAGICNSSQV